MKQKSKSKDKEKINYKYNLREYWSVTKGSRKLIFGIILLVVLAEIVVITNSFLYKKFVDSSQKFIAHSMVANAFVKIILLIALIYIVINIFGSLMTWLADTFLIKFEPQIMYNIKQKYFNHIISLHNEFHANHKSGTLISRLSRGQSAAIMFGELILNQLGPLVVQLIFISLSISIFSWQSAVSLVVVSALFISYSVYINKLQSKKKLELNSNRDKESGFISDAITNVQTIKYYGREKQIGSKLLQYIRRTRKSERKYFSYFAKLGLGQTLVVGLGILAILYFPIKQFVVGDLTLGTVVFIYSLYGNISSSLYSFVWGIRNYYRSMADMQDLFEYGKIKNRIKDSPNAKPIKIKQGSVEFKNVAFAYPEKTGKGKQVFKNFNLKIKPNEKIAFVGHSGSGKTTVAKLLNRFYDIDSGQILVDGVNIKDVIQESLRDETGIVPQEAMLFDDTIYNNIKFAKPTAKKEEIMTAIRFAQLDQVIKDLPKGVNTIVGERGVKLSGGEKQRVSIARAILANKKILVLDEATSSLDTITESEIQKALSKLLEGRTSIIIAHRLSTIMKADRIIVLEKGKIVEEGTHKDLLRRKGKYYNLWKMQSGGYIQE